MPAPDALVSFSYLSSARSPLDAAGLERLLAASRRWNEAHGLTGVLLHNGGSFLQVLEGPRDAVASTFATRIRPSHLHGDIVELFELPLRERAFPHWSMACKHRPGEPLPDLLADPDRARRHAALLDFWRMWD